MIDIKLTENKGFKWFKNNNISVKGFAFYKERFLEDESLIDLFKPVQTEKDFVDTLKSINGLFSVCIQLSNSKAFVASDIIRSLAIFYSPSDRITISDNYEYLLKQNEKRKLNQLAATELISAGFVSGKETLYNNIFTVQAGQYLVIDNTNIKQKSYFNYSTSEFFTDNKVSLLDKSQNTINNTFNRLVSSLNNRTTVIPLSGGLDSRLIACKLKEHNYKNVICYSFGRKENNFEKEISEKVASQLGFKWFFIEYNSDLIGDFYNTSEFKEYFTYYSKCSSSFMFQDFFAVKYLTENNLIPKDSIFIPGYSGDFLGGSQLYKNNGIKYKANKTRIAKSIIDNIYIMTDLSKKEKQSVFQKITPQLEETISDNNKAFAYSIFEDWEIKENLSKFIAQATNIYTFFNYEFRLPYWDLELVSFYKDVPYNYKFGKKLYNTSLDHYFKKYHIDFYKNINLTPNQFRVHCLKKKTLKYIPYLNRFKKNQNTDLLNYSLILKDLIKDLRQENIFTDKIKSLNAYIAHWYIKQLKAKK